MCNTQCLHQASVRGTWNNFTEIVNQDLVLRGPKQSGYVTSFGMMLDQRQTCTQHILPLSTGISHGRSFSLVQAVNQLKSWSCWVAAAFFYSRTIISMSLIRTRGNRFKNVYEGIWLNCPHPLLMVCLCLIALQTSHCERSGWFSDYWSVPGISWSCRARAAFLQWPGWGLTSARLSPAPPLKCQS